MRMLSRGSGPTGRTPAPPPTPDPTPKRRPPKTGDTQCRACLVDRVEANLEVINVPDVGLVPVCINAQICRRTAEAHGVWCTIPPAAVAA